MEAIFNLCELLIMELKILGAEPILDEVNQLAKQLLQIAEKQNLYPLLAKTFLLKAKLSLLKPDLKLAKKLLEEAREIAKEKGFERLAAVISQEQQHLEGNLADWLAEKNSSFIDRLSKIRLEGLIFSLRQNRVEYLGAGATQKSPSMKELESFTKTLRKRQQSW